jgi:hypothetical protein
MESSWDVARALLDIDGLSELLGERQCIIANNWQGAARMSLAGRMLHRDSESEIQHVERVRQHRPR